MYARPHVPVALTTAFASHSDATTKTQVRNVAGRLRGRWLVVREDDWVLIHAAKVLGWTDDWKVSDRENAWLYATAAQTEPFGRLACHQHALSSSS
jgi:hypothetical protein